MAPNLFPVTYLSMATPRTTRSRTAMARASPRSANILQPTSTRKTDDNKPIYESNNEHIKLQSFNEADDGLSSHLNQVEAVNHAPYSHSKPHIAATPAKRMRVTQEPIHRSNDRPQIARSRYARMSLHSFLPNSVVQLSSNLTQSQSSARVDSSGYGLFASADTLIVWRITESNESTSVQKIIFISDDSPSIIDRVCLIDHRDELPSLLYVTQAGSVCFSAWCDEQSVNVSQVSNMRDDTITRMSCINDSLYLMGTAQGRLIALFVDSDTLQQASPRVSLVDVTKKAHSMLSGLVSATGRMLRWSSGNTQSHHQSNKPVLSIIPYFVDNEDFGAYVLHQDALSQWRIMGNERTLLWSTTFNRVLDGQREVRAIAMASMQSRLAILFSVQNEMDEFFRVAIFDAASDSTPPIDHYSRIISLSSSTSYPSHIAVSDGDVPTLFIWSHQDVWVSPLSAHDDEHDDPISSYSFSATAIQGGGLICKFSHEIRTLPSYRQGQCLLVTADTGLVDVRYSPISSDPEGAMSASVSLDSVTPIDVLKASFFFYQRDQLSASRLKLEHAQSVRSMPSLNKSSPELDSVLLAMARELLEAPVAHVEESDVIQSKVDNYESFLQFLRIHKLDSMLSPKAQAIVLMYGEFAAVALSLLSLLHSTERALEKSTTDRKAAAQRRKILHSVMNQCVSQSSQSSKSFNPDRFFTHLTKISNIFKGCHVTDQQCQAVTQASSIKQQDDCCHSLQAVNAILDVVFTESARYRESHVDLNNQTSQHVLRWTVDTAAQLCLKSHCELLASTLYHIKSLPSSFTALRIDLFAAYLRLARLYLLELYDRIKVCPGDEQSLNQFSSLRSLFINDLRRLLPVDLGSHIDVVVDFAAEFHDYESLISINTTAPVQGQVDSTPQLEYLSSCVHRFGQQFADVLFRVAMEQQRPSLLFTLPSPPAQYTRWLADFLHNKPELSWIDDINEHLFTRASSTLSDLAETHHAAMAGMTWSQQKVLLSLSKLSLLCDDDHVHHQAQMISLDESLDVCDAQANAAQGEDAVLLMPDDLIERLLEIAVAPIDPTAYYSTDKERTDTDNEQFLHALDVFHKALYPLRLTSTEEDLQKYSVLSTIWSAIVQVDYPLLISALEDTSTQHVDDNIQLSDDLNNTKLYAVWSHLRNVDYYKRRLEFDTSFQLFVENESWLNEEDHKLAKQLKNTMRMIQKRACQQSNT